ncbi:hypothetical protein [Actinomyces sp. zg296]|nr:hypothetical protein [Actinomyces sp. zg296]
MSRSDDVAPPAADPRAQIKEFLTSRRAWVGQRDALSAPGGATGS